MNLSLTVPTETVGGSSPHTPTPPANVGLLSELARLLGSSLALADSQSPETGEAWEDCFAGKDVAEWLSGTCNITHESAVLVAQSLLDARVFFPKHPAEPLFLDGPDSVYSLWEHAKGERQAAPSGVLTPFTACYSYACRSGKSHQCYSATCARASWRADVDQDSKFLKPAYELKKKTLVLHKKEKLWCNTAPKDVVASLAAKEIKRQEIIFEFVYTEEDYVEDLGVLKEVFLEPVAANTFQIQNNEAFIRNVFAELLKVREANERFLRGLKERQEQAIVVPHVADVFVKHADSFKVYLQHCPFQKLAIQEVEKQRRINKDFNTYCEEKERSLICRRLPLQSFLGRPRGRLIKYRLMLETLLKATPEDCADTKHIPEALDKIKDLLSELDKITGHEENKLSIETINDMIVWKDHADQVDLHLDAPNRELLYSGTLSKRGTELGELQVFLFDHLLLLAKKTKKVKDYWDHSLTVHKEPLPLNAILVLDDKEAVSYFSSQTDAPKQEVHKLGGGFTWRAASAKSKKGGSSRSAPPSPQLGGGMTASQSGHSLSELNFGSSNTTFVISYLGKSGRMHVLRAKTPAETGEWLEKIKAAQRAYEEKSRIFSMTEIPAKLTFNPAENKITCGDVFEGGYVLGTDGAVYACSSTAGEFVKIASLEKVTQIRVVAKYQVVAVLGGKQQSLYTFPLPNLKKLLAVAKDEITEVADSSGSSLIKFGSSGDKDLLAFVRSKADTVIRSVKLMEMDMTVKKCLKKYKKFSVPSAISSVRYIQKANAVVVATELGGFQFINIETCNTQDVIDASDPNIAPLNLKSQQPRVLLPLGETGNFLVCYKEIAFVIDKQGMRVNAPQLITWLGSPGTFALCQKYVLAFSERFIEVWSVEQPQLLQVLPGLRIVHLTDNEDDVSNILVAATTVGSSDTHLFKISL